MKTKLNIFIRWRKEKEMEGRICGPDAFQLLIPAQCSTNAVDFDFRSI